MSDFGGKLRLARERRGVSLRQIAASTKISAAALEALERNDVSKLPGGIFSRAFVRSYAVEVGLDPDETVKEFLARFQEEPAHASSAPSSIRESERSFDHQQRLAGVAVKVVVIGIPLLIGILYVTMRTRIAHSAPAAAAVAIEQPAPGPVAAPPVETPVPSPVAHPESAPRAAATAPAMALELHPTGDCWVRLTVDGRPILARTMHAGEKDLHNVKDSMVIEVGDAGAFAFSIDGRSGKPLGITGQVRSATITRDTASRFLQ